MHRSFSMPKSYTLTIVNGSYIKLLWGGFSLSAFSLQVSWSFGWKLFLCCFALMSNSPIWLATVCMELLAINWASYLHCPILLALIGLILSILRHQHAILIFVISGWLLVATCNHIHSLWSVHDP